MVGQNVFMRSGGAGGWGKVVEVTPTGVVVEDVEPTSLGQLTHFDKDGTSLERTLRGPWKLYLDAIEAGFGGKDDDYYALLLSCR